MAMRTVERRDIDRLSYEEAQNACWKGSTERLETTTICLPTQAELKAVAAATGCRRRVWHTDASGNPTNMEVTYNGCTFYAPVFSWE